VARIHYHCADAVPSDMTDDEFDGWLVYIKTGLQERSRLISAVRKNASDISA
jgi:hypothetical protein